MPEKVFVCGDGHLIPIVSRYLVKMGKLVAIVSSDPSLQIEGADFHEGDPTHIEVLQKAGLESASDVLVVTKEDWDGAFIVLNSRKLNPGAVIVANVNREKSADKLYSLGASRVVFSLSFSGNLIASSAASPALAEFMDRIILTQDIEIGHLEIDEASKLAGRKLGELEFREKTGCWVIGIIDNERKFHPNPGPDASVRNGETLICLGTSEDLRKMFQAVRTVS